MLLLFIAFGVVSTALIIEIFYNFWLLNRETRLIFTSVMMIAQIPYLAFLYFEKNRYGGFLRWVLVHLCFFLFNWFLNIHHFFTIHKENGIFTCKFVTFFVYFVLVVSSFTVLFAIYLATQNWYLRNFRDEKDILPMFEQYGTS